LWWLVVLLALLFAAKSWFSFSSSYVSQYVSSATMVVRSTGQDSAYVDQETAEQMVEVFPYLMKNGVLQRAILDDLGMDTMPGTLSMTLETGTNFFTIKSTANNAEDSYALLQAALRQYPEVVRYIVGRIETEVLDDSGIPAESGREYVLRGSLLKGAAKGAAIGLVIMALYILTRNTVKKRKDLRKLVNLEDFGSIPLVPMKKRRKKTANRAVNLNNERVSQVYMEAIRKLRIKVLREMENNGYRSLLITSSVSGEGKTTIAVNLALALARQGKHVILVDGDLRNPSVATTMGETKEHPGIGAVLHKEITWEKTLVSVEVERGKLEILYGGQPDKTVAHYLGTERMNKVVKSLEERADIVIFDTAPSDLTADAAMLAKYVDAALYVVRCDYARKGRIRGGISALAESDAKILGYVFNADSSKKGSGYGYGYGGYGRYGSYGSYGSYGMRKKEDLSGRVIKD